MPKSVKELEQDKYERMMNAVDLWVGYYRANPQRFVEEVLGIKLKWFQKILIWAMMNYNYTMYLAARGQGAPIFI